MQILREESQKLVQDQTLPRDQTSIIIAFLFFILCNTSYSILYTCETKNQHSILYISYLVLEEGKWVVLSSLLFSWNPNDVPIGWWLFHWSSCVSQFSINYHSHKRQQTVTKTNEQLYGFQSHTYFISPLDMFPTTVSVTQIGVYFPSQRIFFLFSQLRNKSTPFLPI